ncbi:DUF2577 domain-containing protein [Lysinibacillus capsici]|uniref:DUF2577 domain-containing protein n=1 Tax=Lysinibacillus TaxID=400634 RepID=UPI00272F6934|nr:DUF2577 domain-containing protein [Lysinibacillus capsici]MDP1394762.1 DUF2577 domain-containing protein [Lysinibacillus capsici]MDP1415177.1 DUF2577 domain-containing protein [Lysinibacillus capsici]MDP1431125.1 DUF2577 domain-containing protein [Lysinibacillus capsici]
MDSITTLAKMLKQNENPKPVSMSTGIVISPPPNAQIRLNDTVILGNNRLVFAAHVLEDYEREIELEGDIRFTDSPFQRFEAKEVKSTTKDTLKEGDEVILLPTADEQLYFVVGKAVRFE